MDFGRGTYEGMVEADFQLVDRKQIVLSGERVSNPKIYFGLEKWGRNEWIGKIYPPKTKEKDFLNYYVQHFNSIELKALHYQLYSKATVENWVSKVGDRDFLFCPKMYKGVTHHGSLKGKDFVSRQFFNAVDAFGKHLGPIFIQVSDAFGTKRKNELFEYLNGLPRGYNFFLEVRNEHFFSDKDEFEELSAKLRELGIGLLISDTPKRRDVVHMNLTTSKIFVRLFCRGGDEMDKYRVELWRKQLEQWFNNGLECCYFFLHLYNPQEAPYFAKYVQEQLNEVIK